MRFLMMVKGDKDYEAGRPPKPELMAAIATFTEAHAKEGTLLESGGLLPSSFGARLRAADGQINITDGPFSEAKELIGGYAIIRVASRADAIENGKQFLQIHIDVLGPTYQGELEVRQLYDGPEEAEEARKRP